MRIVFLSPVGVIGGAERVLLGTAAALAGHERAAELHAVLGSDGALAEKLRSRGIAVHVLPLPARLESLGDTQATLDPEHSRSRLWFRLALAAPDAFDYAHKLRRLLHQLQPDLIHSNGLKMHLLSALSRPRDAVLLWHMHDFPSFRPAMVRLLRWMRCRCNGIVAVSDAVAREVQTTIPNLPVHVIRNAVDLDEFTPLGPVADLDALAGLPPAPVGSLRVGLVATYARWKGHDVFLQAAARIRHPHCRFYVIGGPIYRTAGSQFSRPELEALANSLGIRERLGFVDFQPDPAPVYRALDVVVHASRRPEPFGLTIAEAMACGRCVVASRAGGASELFEDGVEAVGFSPGKVHQLAEVLDTLLADPQRRRQLQNQAIAAARSNFGVHRYGHELGQVYERLMKRISMNANPPEKPTESSQTILTSPSQSLK